MVVSTRLNSGYLERYRRALILSGEERGRPGQAIEWLERSAEAFAALARGRT